MTAHGPDSTVFEKATEEKLQPVKLRPDGLAFMFETNRNGFFIYINHYLAMHLKQLLINN